MFVTSLHAEIKGSFWLVQFHLIGNSEGAALRKFTEHQLLGSTYNGQPNSNADVTIVGASFFNGPWSFNPQVGNRSGASIWICIWCH